jgi:hypothetical protein
MNTLRRTGANVSPDRTSPCAADDAEETLIVDCRADLRPAQMVELKLRALLRGKALQVSHIQMVDSLRKRN